MCLLEVMTFDLHLDNFWDKVWMQPFVVRATSSQPFFVNPLMPFFHIAHTQPLSWRRHTIDAVASKQSPVNGVAVVGRGGRWRGGRWRGGRWRGGRWRAVDPSSYVQQCDVT